eukprot:8202974-Pyramimonas_sp.AAC.1
MVQVRFGCGTRMVQVWFKCSSGVVASSEAAACLITRIAHRGASMVQVCFKCSSGVLPSSEGSAWLITRSARVLQVWFRCGSGMVQAWFKCGSSV